MMKMTGYKTKFNAGFTLLEMMIAVTLGLLILASVSAVAINSARSSRANDRTSELQTNGRYALDVLRRDLQHAGQSGLTPPSGLAAARASGYFATDLSVSAITNDCATGFALTLEQPIWGNDNADPFLATCIPTAKYSSGDVLAVRYADMNSAPALVGVAPTIPMVANDIYFRSTYYGGRLFQNGVTPTTALIVAGNPMQDQLLKSYVYYISPNSPGTTDGIPALARLSLTGGAMVEELVASGIENMQIQYGVVDASGNTQYMNAGSVTAATSWPLVKSVRVWLLARNSTNERGEAYSNQTTYQMGNVSYTPTSGSTGNSQFRRQLFSLTVQLRNEN